MSERVGDCRGKLAKAGNVGGSRGTPARPGNLGERL